MSLDADDSVKILTGDDLHNQDNYSLSQNSVDNEICPNHGDVIVAFNKVT